MCKIRSPKTARTNTEGWEGIWQNKWERTSRSTILQQCAVEVLQVEPSKIVPEARFADDLDADSLDLVELVMALEERFGIDVPESELEGVQTVGQAYELVTSKL